MKVTRRGWFGIASAILVSPFAYVSSRLDALESTISGTDEDPLLVWCRAVNTLESRYAAANNKFANLETLRKQVPSLSNRVSDLPQLPRGARIWFEIDTGTAYRVAVWDPVGSIVWRTDHTGVIYRTDKLYGLPEEAAEGIVFGMSVTPLRGAPARPTRQGFRGHFDRIAEFFFPTLQAAGCCCGSCVFDVPCHRVCEQSVGCCNVGFESCPWCCPNNCCCV